eukprot:TRINITY_DN1685_c0_g1_i2.p1 TRINITY_DN1685_c0_g1~~TRINITY_DN1685_c0_g1_i2.p1  ORF type:complete len:492 (-),score=4.35 TRINITY_DN1685_c0_g1_i2:69-1544(-)
MLSYTIEGRKTRKTFNPAWMAERSNPNNITHSRITEENNAQEEEEKIGLDWWFEDICMLDMDYFVRTIAAIKAKGVRAELIGAIISHYAIKWLPGLVHQQRLSANFLENHSIQNQDGLVAAHRKNRYVLETLITLLPPEEEAVSCSFLLRLVRMANIVGAGDVYKAELERRVGLQLDKATLPDLLIPSFSHAQDTIFDVHLVYRIVRCFLERPQREEVEEEMEDGALVQVAKLLDGYLAEVALDAKLDVGSFECVANCLPCYARVCHDGLYRAVDTYLKAHPGMSEEERRRLCKLMDCMKLSMDAFMHASQNERLPLRTVIHVIFCHVLKSTTHHPFHSGNATCFSSTSSVNVDFRYLHQQVQRLAEDLSKLQGLCSAMRSEIESLKSPSQGFASNNNNNICNNNNGNANASGIGFPWKGLKKIARMSFNLRRNSVPREKDGSNCSFPHAAVDHEQDPRRQPTRSHTYVKHETMTRGQPQERRWRRYSAAS